MKIDADTPFTVEGLRVFVRGDNQPGTLGAAIAELFSRADAADELREDYHIVCRQCEGWDGMHKLNCHSDAARAQEGTR
jgi:hypothetical protein